jgi:plastocyanin
MRGMNIRKQLLLACASALAIGLIGPACGDDDGDGATATPTSPGMPAGGIPANLRTITVSDDEFSPRALQVPIGTEVFWQWTGKQEHQLTGTFKGNDGDIPVESPRMKGPGTFSYEFKTNGLFEYHCAVHGEAMSGQVIVK